MLALLLASLIMPFKATTVSSPPQANVTPTGVVSLSDLRGRSRPLLIFAPKPDDPQLEIQLRRVQAHAAVITERDVVVIAIPYQSPSTTAAMLSGTDAQTVRRRFNVAPDDFQVILIGKDGGEKLRSSKPISIDKLRDTIDAMPMRQQEMQSGTGADGAPSSQR